MKRFKVLLSGLIITTLAFSQDDWQPITHITGYINTSVEYTNLDNVEKGTDFRGALENGKVGIGLSQFGLLASYQPLRDLELKSTLIYSQYTKDIFQLFVEAYGLYTFSEKFKLGVGRFLTPLSPVNLYFYAPLNPSGANPMVVSHHFIFPQNINGFQINGVFEQSNTTFGYAASLGNYTYSTHYEPGILGVLSQEDTHPHFGFADFDELPTNFWFGSTARLYATFNYVFTIGGNLFMGDAQQVVNTPSGLNFVPSEKHTIGLDLHLELDFLKINAEYWTGKQETSGETDSIMLPNHITNEYEALYAEVIYVTEKFQPFLRYDYIQDVNVGGIDFPGTATTIGIAFRPRFETLLKFEYKYIQAKKGDFATRTSKDYDYDFLQFSYVLSF